MKNLELTATHISWPFQQTRTVLVAFIVGPPTFSCLSMSTFSSAVFSLVRLF